MMAFALPDLEQIALGLTYPPAEFTQYELAEVCAQAARSALVVFNNQQLSLTGLPAIWVTAGSALEAATYPGGFAVQRPPHVVAVVDDTLLVDQLTMPPEDLRAACASLENRHIRWGNTKSFDRHGGMATAAACVLILARGGAPSELPPPGARVRGWPLEDVLTAALRHQPESPSSSSDECLVSTSGAYFFI
jgi:hypothetical protein